jgi:integrase
MSRKPLPLGAWGNIHTDRTSARSWRAETRYRDMDGKVRRVEARGASAAEARRVLQQKLVKRQTPGQGLVTSVNKINQLIEVFLVELEGSDKASRTKDKYAYCVKKYITPAIGSIRIGEASSGVIDHFIRKVVEDVGPSTARSCGAVLSWMFKVALRHDAVTVNPVIGISIPRNKKAKPQALDASQYQDLREKLIAWEKSPALGRPRTQELHEIADFLIHTGLRPGEFFALRWDDIKLESVPPTVFINATVIRTSTGGVRIQDHPKSRHGVRRVTAPDYLVKQLQIRHERQVKSGTLNPLGLVFPSSTGTVCDPNNVGKNWRKAADAVGYDWVTFRTLRKSSATLIARTMGPEAAAYQLGHSKVSMTQEHYIEEYQEALDTRAVMDAFSPKDPEEEPPSTAEKDEK